MLVALGIFILACCVIFGIKYKKTIQDKLKNNRAEEKKIP